MKIWVDDIRTAPPGYVWCKSTDETIGLLKSIVCNVDVIDLDHDAGDYAKHGGDYIKILDWMEKTGRSYPIHIHSMNPVGAQNMRTIIQYNGWEEK